MQECRHGKGMLRLAFLIAAKDLRILLGRGGGIARPLLLGLLLIFVFSIAGSGGSPMSGSEAAAIFWLSSTFCQILIFNQLYALEEVNGARIALALSPYHPAGIWLGKSLCGMAILLLAQALFVPATLVFLGQHPSGEALPALVAIAGADVGICALGSLMGAVACGGRESLLSIVLFPLLVPVLLAGISLCGQYLDGSPVSGTPWMGILGAFDAIFSAAALALFGFLYRGDD